MTRESNISRVRLPFRLPRWGSRRRRRLMRDCTKQKLAPCCADCLQALVRHRMFSHRENSARRKASRTPLPTGEGLVRSRTEAIPPHSSKKPPDFGRFFLVFSKNSIIEHVVADGLDILAVLLHPAAAADAPRAEVQRVVHDLDTLEHRLGGAHRAVGGVIVDRTGGDR